MIILSEKSGEITLKGQGCCVLPVILGANRIHIKVSEGSLRLNHCCYTPDGGTWLSFPNGGRQAHYDLSAGNEYDIVIDIQTSFDKQDKAEIVNTAFFHKAIFEYDVKN